MQNSKTALQNTKAIKASKKASVCTIGNVALIAQLNAERATKTIPTISMFTR